LQISRPTRGFCFGPFELDSDTGELRNNGVPVHLQPQPLQVLQLLLENAGKLVSREQLQQQLWPEETFVEFEVGLNQAIKKLRDALVDSSHKPLYIETIPRRGYRFIFPVEIIRPTETPTEPAPRVPAPFGKRGLLILIVLLFIVSALGLWQYHSRQIPLQPHQPIVVVPFRNLTQDPQVEWLSTGFAEMLTTNLAQMNGVDVLSPERLVVAEKRLNKAQPETKATTPGVVKEAGARVYVSGSLIKISAAKIVVQIRMQDVDTGKLLFTDNLEAQNPEGIFQLANTASARLGSLFLAGTDAKQQQPSIQEITTANPEAYRHYLAGNDYHGHALSPEAYREWREAIRLDPQFALAYLRLLDFHGASINPESDHLARILNEIEGRLPRAEKLEFAAIKTRRASDIDGAIEARERILAHSPRDSLNRLRLSQLLGYYRFETDRAAALLRAGLPLDPRDSGLWNNLAYAEALRGDESAAMEACRRNEVLTGPDDPNAWSTRGDVLFAFGHNDDAVVAYEKVTTLKPDFADYWQYMVLAAIHADQGRVDLAQQDLGRYVKLSGGHRYADAMPVLQAQILEAQGNPEGALALYRKAS
jgi:DNA-binding winged helix-turn-helix (wHTH) protein/TolB-like protein/Flp pilus assembly protein TadD